MSRTQPYASGSVPDATALEIFQNQWEIYRKFLRHDYLGNAGAYAALRRYLDRDVQRSFGFVDMACGDASGIVGALQDTSVATYRGVDLSAPALALARDNLAALRCAVQLDEADFASAMRAPAAPADIVWISLSLHHLETEAKCAFMREVRGALSPEGAFLAYEPTRRDDESRAEYLDRFEDIGRQDWTELTPEEFAEAMKHVRTCDLPETVSGWAKLGEAAGFSSSTELFRSDRDLFRVFLYRL